MKNNLILVLLCCCMLLFQSCDKNDGAGEPNDGQGPGSEVPVSIVDLSCKPIGNGIAYEVGPGKKYENIVDVPFEDLKHGDVVQIYPKDKPYYERIIISNAKGTKEEPICICGMLNEKGERPVLDGANAAVRPVNISSYFNEITAYLAMIVIANRWDDYPENIVIKNLTIQGANQYNGDGSQKYKVMGTDKLEPYSKGASGIWMRGTNIDVINCVVQENGNGIFGAYNGPEEQLVNVHLYNNIIRNNGTKGDFLQHNVYLEADSLVAIGNQIGPLREGAEGANYKSRGAGDVIMYNKLVGPAARHFDLVESQNGYDWLSKKPAFRRSIVVGNIVEGADVGAGNILHYGGDGDNSTPSDDLRQGTVYAYNNTFLLKGYYASGDPNAVWRKSFMDLNTCNEKLFAFNNIFAYSNTGKEGSQDVLISVFRTNGSVGHFTNNIVSDVTKSWYNEKTNGDPCQQNLGLEVIESAKATNEAIKFVALGSGDFTLQVGSKAIDAGMSVPDGLPLVKYQFKAPNSIEERPNDGVLDIGAYEFKK